MKRLPIIVLAALLVLAGGLYWGVPAFLSMGGARDVPGPDFAEAENWIRHPDPLPPAVWEGGWALDFLVLPYTPKSLAKAGFIDTSEGAAREQLLDETAALGEALSVHGAVYMPALRVPSATIRRPDLATTREDLVAALSAYVADRNRGRGLAIIAPEQLIDLVNQLPDLLAEADASDIADRVVLLVVPKGAAGLRPPGPDQGFTALVVARPQMLDAGFAAADLVALPNPQGGSLRPADRAAFEAYMAESAAAALRRVAERARKTVEPFGELEEIQVAPIMRPREGGLPQQ